jgi:TRAP-type C4-dicarboxylate transport system permease small subunit
MAEQTHDDALPSDPFGRALHRLCVALAVFGGFLACAMAVLVAVSVTGRYLFSAPVPGDYDLVGIISGCAVFAFLPYCQLRRGNVVVDFFTTGVPARGKALLDAIGSLLYLLIAVIFTWRMYYGMLELRNNHEVIAAFNFFRWWTMPLNIVCMIVLIVVIFYTLTRDINDIKTGQESARTVVSGE